MVQGLSLWNINFLNERVIYELAPQEGTFSSLPRHDALRMFTNFPAMAQYSTRPQYTDLTSLNAFQVATTLARQPQLGLTGTTTVSIV